MHTTLMTNLLRLVSGEEIFNSLAQWSAQMDQHSGIHSVLYMLLIL